MAEYAKAYGVPDPDMPWPLFMCLIDRITRFEARALLRQMDGTLWAIASALQKDGAALMSSRDRVERLAYPWASADRKILIRGNHAGT